MTVTSRNLSRPGTVVFVRSARARRMNLRVQADATIRVAIPPGGSLQAAEAFVRSRQDWIEQQLRQKQESLNLIAGLTVPSDGFDPDQARTKITTRLRELTAAHNFTYRKLNFRNQKSRWGSCSANNDLSLNLKLALLPDDLLDLVLLHELVHTEIKNHGPGFHHRLAALCPDARALDRRLRQYTALLRPPLTPFITTEESSFREPEKDEPCDPHQVHPRDG
ncbi:MAG TPA: DUF45 domain-containing protein [Proteobacteria bacterium]|nr:DUF45 domain-containing protein [Pseudomonadota bacterium]